MIQQANHRLRSCRDISYDYMAKTYVPAQRAYELAKTMSGPTSKEAVAARDALNDIMKRFEDLKHQQVVARSQVAHLLSAENLGITDEDVKSKIDNAADAQQQRDIETVERQLENFRRKLESTREERLAKYRRSYERRLRERMKKRTSKQSVFVKKATGSEVERVENRLQRLLSSQDKMRPGTKKRPGRRASRESLEKQQVALKERQKALQMKISKLKAQEKHLSGRLQEL